MEERSSLIRTLVMLILRSDEGRYVTRYAQYRAVDHGRMGVEPIKPAVYIPLLKEPDLEHGVGKCEYYCTLTHEPAQKYFNSKFPALPDNGQPDWDVSRG